MWSVLKTAWKVMVKRAIADRLILAAALITVVLATVLLAAGPIYSDAVTLAGLRRTLEDAPVTESNAVVEVRSAEAGYDDLAAIAERQIQRAFTYTGGQVYRRATSESYALPNQPEGAVRNLTIFRYFDQFWNHATIADGRRPEVSGQPYEVAISDSAAEALGLNVGDTFQVTNRRDEAFQPEVRIVGVYSVTSPSSPYWYDDQLDTQGVEVGSSFTTYGPLVVPPETFTELIPFGAEFEWRVFPNIDQLTVGEIDDWRQSVALLESRLNTNQPAGSSFSVETGLVRILDETERSLLVTRSGVLLLTIQLAILAGYALFLTANLLASHREIETNLLRARGAGNRQIAALTIMEAALLIVPTVLVAPWLAVLALRLLNWAGPLADIDLSITPVVTSTAYLLAIVAGLGAMVALVIPALRASRAFANPRASRSRQAPRAFIQQAGVDLALLVIAGIALWQLRRFGAPISRTVEGRIGIDPLLVSAPALGLLAGAVLALRTIPMLARVAERIASQRSRLAPALSAWQMARRPLTYARSALLLMLAIGIGLFAVSYTDTWRGSQEDQAAYQIGADIRVDPDQRIGQALPGYVLPDSYATFGSYDQSMAVIRDFGQLSRSAGSGRFMLLDAAAAPDVVRFRPDLATDPFPELMQRLTAERPEIATLTLPGEPQKIAITASADVAPLSEGDKDRAAELGIEPDRLDLAFTLQIIVQDGRGLLYRIEIGDLASDGSVSRIEKSLIEPLGDRGNATPVYPISIMSIEFHALAPQQFARYATLTLSGIEVSNGDDWQSVEISPTPSAWEATVSDLPLAYLDPSITLGESTEGNALTASISSGSTGSQISLPVVFAVRPSGSETQETLSAIVTDHLLVANGLQIGDTITLPGMRGPTVEARIVGSVHQFPTVDPASGEAIVLDLPTYQAFIYDPGSLMPEPEEYWISTAGESSEEMAATLTDPPFSSADVVSLEQRESVLLADPVALGTIGALMLGFVAAGIFAGVGFIVSAAIAARERLTEFALLRAVGLSARELVGWLSLEHGVLIILSLVGGTILGLGLSWVILPLVAITQQAREAVPEVIVSYPWATIVGLEVAMLVVLVVAVGGLVFFLRRIGLGSLLRMGGE